MCLRGGCWTHGSDGPGTNHPLVLCGDRSTASRCASRVNSFAFWAVSATQKNTDRRSRDKIRYVSLYRESLSDRSRHVEASEPTFTVQLSKNSHRRRRSHRVGCAAARSGRSSRGRNTRGTFAADRRPASLGTEGDHLSAASHGRRARQGVLSARWNWYRRHRPWWPWEPAGLADLQSAGHRECTRIQLSRDVRKCCREGAVQRCSGTAPAASLRLAAGGSGLRERPGTSALGRSVLSGLLPHFKSRV